MTNKTKSLLEKIKALFSRLFGRQDVPSPVESEQVTQEPVAQDPAPAPVVKEKRRVVLEPQPLSDRFVRPTLSFSEMDWPEFEELVYEIFRQRGYAVAEKRVGIDGGVDLVIQINNDITFVLCKQWKEQKVDVAAVVELHEVMETENAQHGIVITSGIFTPAALDFSLGKKLLLINGDDLYQMVQALTPRNDSDESETGEMLTEETSGEPAQQMPELEPLCPICSEKMIKRIAKKGKNAGNTFWGCSKFPNCRGVVAN